MADLQPVWLTASCELCGVFGPVHGQPADVVWRLLQEWRHVRIGCPGKIRLVSISTPVPHDDATAALVKVGPYWLRSQS